MKRCILAFAILGAWISTTWADQFSLNINGNSAEVDYIMDMNGRLGYQGEGNYQTFVRILHRRNTLWRAGFSLLGSLENAESFQVGGGLEGVFGSDYIATPLFVRLSYVLPLNDPIPLTRLSGRIAYAPSVLSFSDANQFTAYRLELDTQIVPRFHLYTGYRHINSDYKTHDRLFDHSWYGGIRFYF